jgi:L-alanine-DL-glutamate epimerase-like enolase superfamily enzyme
MKVEAVHLQHVRIPLKRAFKHALHERNHADAALVTVVGDDGSVGWGEIQPRRYVTGESMDDVLATEGPEMARALVGTTLSSWGDATGWLEAQAAARGPRLATLCGFDLALLDAMGQSLSEPLETVLGGMSGPSLPAGVIVGFEQPTEKVARYCATLRLSGKKHVKVKVGLEDDTERLAAIVKVFKTLPLRLDANAAWTVDEAIERLGALQAVAPIASIEQPVVADDIEGLRRIQAETGIAVMADESLRDLADAEQLIERQAASIFNVRLGKNGGVWAAHRLCARAREAGVQIHLGTMVGETGVLSRASEVFGRCEPGFDCLDGKGQNAFLLEVDILGESSHHRGQSDGSTRDSDGAPGAAPGLGVCIDEAIVEQHRVGDVQRF